MSEEKVNGDTGTKSSKMSEFGSGKLEEKIDSIPKGEHGLLKITLDGTVLAQLRSGYKRNWKLENLQKAKSGLEDLLRSIRSHREYCTYQANLLDNWEQKWRQESKKKEEVRRRLSEDKTISSNVEEKEKQVKETVAGDTMVPGSPVADKSAKVEAEGDVDATGSIPSKVVTNGEQQQQQQQQQRDEVAIQKKRARDDDDDVSEQQLQEGAEHPLKRQKVDSASPLTIRLPNISTPQTPASSATTPSVASVEEAPKVKETVKAEPVATTVGEARPPSNKAAICRKSSKKQQAPKKARKAGRTKRRRSTVIDEEEDEEERDDEEYRPPDHEGGRHESDEDFVIDEEDVVEEDEVIGARRSSPSSSVASLPKRLVKTKDIARHADDYIDDEDDIGVARRRGSAQGKSSKQSKKGGRTKRKGKGRSTGSARSQGQRATSRIPDLEPFPEDESFGFNKYLEMDRTNMLYADHFWKHVSTYFAPITKARLKLLEPSRYSSSEATLPRLGLHYSQQWAREDAGLPPLDPSLGNGLGSLMSLSNIQSTDSQPSDQQGSVDGESGSIMLDLNAASAAYSGNLISQRLLSSLVEERELPTAYVDGTLDGTYPQESETPRKKKKGRPRIHKPPEMPASPIDPNEQFLLQQLLEQINANQGDSPQQSNVTTHDYNPGTMMSLDERLVQELQSIGVFPMDTSVEEVSFGDREDDEICSEIRSLQQALREHIEKGNHLKSKILAHVKSKLPEDEKRYEILETVQQWEADFNRHLTQEGELRKKR